MPTRPLGPCVTDGRTRALAGFFKGPADSPPPPQPLEAGPGRQGVWESAGFSPARQRDRPARHTLTDPVGPDTTQEDACAGRSCCRAARYTSIMAMSKEERYRVLSESRIRVLLEELAYLNRTIFPRRTGAAWHQMTSLTPVEVLLGIVQGLGLSHKSKPTPHAPKKRGAASAAPQRRPRSPSSPARAASRSKSSSRRT